MEDEHQSQTDFNTQTKSNEVIKKSMKFVFNKNRALFLAVIVWVVFSLGYIVYDQYNEFKLRKLKNAYDQGMVAAGKAVLKQSSSCQPFTITVDEESVELIGVKCLKKAEETPGAQPVATPTR